MFYWKCNEIIYAVKFLLENISVRSGIEVYRQIAGIPIGTNCAAFLSNWFLCCYESQFMANFSKDPSKLHCIGEFRLNTHRYLDNICFR